MGSYQLLSYLIYISLFTPAFYNNKKKKSFTKLLFKIWFCGTGLLLCFVLRQEIEAWGPIAFGWFIFLARHYFIRWSISFLRGSKTILNYNKMIQSSGLEDAINSSRNVEKLSKEQKEYQRKRKMEDKKERAFKRECTLTDLTFWVCCNCSEIVDTITKFNCNHCGHNRCGNCTLDKLG